MLFLIFCINVTHKNFMQTLCPLHINILPFFGAPDDASAILWCT